MITDYHLPRGDDNINFWPGVLFWVGFEAGIGISMKFRYGRSNFRICSMGQFNFFNFLPLGWWNFIIPL